MGSSQLTDSEGWAYLFFLLGGLAALIIVIAWFAIPPDDAKSLVAVSDRRIDWVGGLVVTAAICLFTISLIDSGVNPRGWAAPRTSHFLPFLS
jgi:predicted MFS family arabinose efflux permease